MRFLLLPLCLLPTLVGCEEQSKTVRYEPLKNMNITEDTDLWKQGSDIYVRSYGLSFEWLEVTTEDNVKIKIHHFWNPRVKGTKIPVLMLPPILTDGDVFLLNRPEGNFAMTLATQGYDIFVANYRASRYSPIPAEKYVSTTVDDNTFLDIPPVFDFVLNFTNQPKLHLVGYSKGSTVSMSLLSNRVEYNDKIRLLILLAPVSYIETPNPFIGTLMSSLKASMYMGGTAFADLFDTNVVFKLIQSDPIPAVLQFLVTIVPVLPTCIINFIWTGVFDCISKLNFDTDLVEKALTRGFPQSLYARELTQFTQNSEANALQSYSSAWLDKDPAALLFGVYPGTKKYDLTKISCPITILQVSRDEFSQPEDYKRMRDLFCSKIIRGKLSPHKYVFQVKVPNYQHVDPFVGRNNDQIYVNAYYMIMREFDIARDSSLQAVLGYIEPNFENLVPQSCG